MSVSTNHRLYRENKMANFSGSEDVKCINYLRSSFAEKLERRIEELIVFGALGHE